MIDLSTVPRLGRHSAKVAELRALARGRQPGRTMADGLKLVTDLLASGAPVDDIVVADSLLERLARLPEFAPHFSRRRVFVVADSVLEDLAPTRSPQGVVATLRVEPASLSAEGIAVYLDRVQDPGNVGAVIRTAVAFGATGVACSSGCGDPFAPKALRASAGTVLAIPIETETAFEPLATRFRAAGGTVAATVGTGGRDATRWRPRLPLLLIFGNEGQGVAPDLAAACDETVTIPLQNGVESLNVAVTAGALLAALAGVVPSPILDS